MKIRRFFVACSALVIFLTACSGLKPKPTPTPTPIPTIPPTLVQRYHFVTNKLLVPTTQEQAKALALNVDGDPQQGTDNLVGQLLSMLVAASPGLEFQPTVDEAINSGQIVTLHLLQTDDLTNASSASWSIFLGQAVQAPPDFDGSDTFTLDPAAPTNSVLTGSIVNGHFSGGAGKLRVKVAFLDKPVELDLVGVRLETDVRATGCVSGKLGGGIAVAEFRAKLLPALVDGMNSVAQVDAGAAGALLQIFDADQNGTITPEEIESNPLVQIALAPDVDLMDAAGQFNPRQDGVKDSLSVGLGFACTAAKFTTPDN